MSSQPAENYSRLPRKAKKQLKNETVPPETHKVPSASRRHLHVLPKLEERPYRSDTPKEKSKPAPRRPVKTKVFTWFADTLRDVDPKLYDKATDPNQNLSALVAEALGNQSLQDAADYHGYEPSWVIKRAIEELIRQPAAEENKGASPKLTQAQQAQRANTPPPPPMVDGGKTRRKGAPKKVSSTIVRTDIEIAKEAIHALCELSPEIKNALIAGSFDQNDAHISECIDGVRRDPKLANPRKIKVTVKTAVVELRLDYTRDGASRSSERSIIPGVELKKDEPVAKTVPKEQEREPLSPKMQALFDRLPTPVPGTTTAHGNSLSKEGIEKAERFLNSPRP